MLNIKGTFRVQSIYQNEKAAYLTLKDKDDNGIVKVAVDLPLPAGVIDDALISLDGKLVSRLFGNNVSLKYAGVVKPVSETK